MKTLRIGIGSAADVKAYKAALARRRLWWMAGEPESWVSSAQSLGKLLDENWPLLREIRRRPPRSMSELAGRNVKLITVVVRDASTMRTYARVASSFDESTGL